MLQVYVAVLSTLNAKQHLVIFKCDGAIVICLHLHHFSICTVSVSDIVLNHLLYYDPTDSHFYSYSLLDELDLLSKNSEIKICSAELHYFYTNFEYGECDMFCM